MPDTPDNTGDVTRRVLDRCRELGFAAFGIAGASPSAFRAELLDWIDAGKHGEMAWLAERAELRADPGKALDGARSAIMVADLYAARSANTDPPLEPGRGRVARYARGRDYHKTIKKRLHALADGLRERYPEAGFKAFVDTAPVPERELAARAGIGWTGKHTLTINPKLGSYMLLGGVLTTLELEPPPEQAAITDHCGTCTRCIEACPTDAITPYSVDATRCISYLTIEHRGPIDPAFHGPIGSWLFGCDICQEVCPHNSPKPGTDQPEVRDDYRAARESFDLLEVLGWTEDDRRRELRGSAMKRGKLEMWRRNALICLANQGHTDAVERAFEDPSALVRRTARDLLDAAAAQQPGRDAPGDDDPGPGDEPG